MIKLSATVKKIPERSCVGCGNSFHKNELIRVVRTQDGVCLDKTGKKPGRGAYICCNGECLKKARKAKKLERALSVEITDELYNALQAEMSENEN